MLTHYPTISIITPSYNQGAYIEQTILSIINQGYPNLEYIIIDGGSTDDTVQIIEKYAAHITYWVSEPDKGQSDAINKGLAHCTGTIFNWINSDDYLEPGALFAIAHAFMQHPQALQVSGYCRIFEEGTNATMQLHRCMLFADTATTIVEQRINQPGAFYQLAVVKALGGVNTQLHYVMDLALWLRFLCAYGQERIVLIDDTIAHFRVHPNSKTASFEERFRKESAGLYRSILSDLQAAPALVQYFAVNERYQPEPWSYAAVQTTEMEQAIAAYYIYQFYKAGDYAATKIAMQRLRQQGKFPLHWNHCRMLLKVYTGI
ncbi:glycosyltransferase family 2 protein [Ferruginibacter yonginensis]|uniref:Glycosyltransferase family 2 protein n=1 Tax=Ferruginibacter yonginensis TaxID=1310416 RepID=A0ABV8QPE4_9BACT